jgi:hypothetical protein
MCKQYAANKSVAKNAETRNVNSAFFVSGEEQMDASRHACPMCIEK